MLRFIKKLKKRLFTENKFTKYLLYAIGEIILVVIGILIAVSINNRNQSKIKRTQLKNIYSIVKQDLSQDTVRLNDLIKGYKKKDIELSKIINNEYSDAYFDQFNASNYEECVPCNNWIIFNFAPFYPQQKGYNLLSSFDKEDDQVLGELSDNILAFYSGRVNDIEELLSFLRAKTHENLEFVEQFPWFLDYFKGNYNPAIIDFFKNNYLFKNKVASFQIYCSENYLVSLESYKKDAIELLEKMEKY